MTAISELPAPVGALTGMERLPGLKGASNAGIPLFAAASAPNGTVLALMRPFLADTAATADADPGAGNVRWNHATQASATVIYVDDVDSAAADISAALATITSGGFLYLQGVDIAGANVFQKWQVGAVTDAAGYTKLAVSLVASSGSFADDAALLLSAQQPNAAAGASPVGRHAVPLMAASWSPRQSGGCASLAYLSGAANQPDIPYLAFDPTSSEAAEICFVMPPSWDEGSVTCVPIWAHPAATTNFGTCWKFRAVAVSNDDPLAATFGAAQSSVDTGGTTTDFYAGPETAAITIAGSPAPGDLVCLQCFREPTDGGDTLAVDAYLLGVVLFLNTSAATD